MEPDAELYDNLKELNLLIDERTTDQTTFAHHHFICNLRRRDQWDNEWRSPEARRHDILTYSRRRHLPIHGRLQIFTETEFENCQTIEIFDKTTDIEANEFDLLRSFQNARVK
jgi:hypothetical protein